MTPTQLRAFSAVVRHGSVKRAAAELEVSESAVSINIAQLRKELGDRLFRRTASGLAFTPGGLRLASRSVEMLGLQERTIREVSQAAAGRRLLRVASSSMFAEHAAPGLIELFTGRAADLDVELSITRSDQFEGLLLSRAVDVAVGPQSHPVDESVTVRPFLNYQVVAVAAPQHRLTRRRTSAAELREQTWLLGPSAASDRGPVRTLLRRLAVPGDHQQIFQSHSAAVEEAKRGHGVAMTVAYAVAADLADGRLVRVGEGIAEADGVWSTFVLSLNGVSTAAAEFVRFVTTPRAIQSMLRGSGVNVAHFRPSIHVTLWS